MCSSCCKTRHERNNQEGPRRPRLGPAGPGPGIGCPGSPRAGRDGTPRFRGPRALISARLGRGPSEARMCIRPYVFGRGGVRALRSLSAQPSSASSCSAARCEGPFLHISARAGGVQPRRAHDSAGRVSLHVHVTTAALNGSASAEGGRPQMLTLQCGPRSGGPSHCASPRGGPTQLRRTRASVGRISLRGVVTVAAPNASASAGGRDLQASTLCTAGPCVESQISTRACTTGPHSYGVHVSPESASRSTPSARRRPRTAPPALGGDL